MSDHAFRIEQRQDQREYGKATLVISGCHRGLCRVPLWQKPALDNGNTKRWQWDGNIEQPTITPSLNCNGQGGCGWHVTITKGVAHG
jgi:hypothetical protein